VVTVLIEAHPISLNDSFYNGGIEFA